VPAKASFFREVRPVLQEHCQGCHQPAKHGGEYVMSPFPAFLKGGESGEAAIVPGKPEASNLVKMIAPTKGKDGAEKAEMPKEQPPLAAAQIELIARWIREGATDDTPASAAVTFDAEHPPVYRGLPVLSALDFSPDGMLLAVSGYHEVLLHKADGSELAGRLVGLSERVQSLAFSPDGKWLAVAGGSPARLGEIQIWNVADRKLALSVPMTYDTLYGVSWSPDGARIAFGCADNTVRAIDAKTGKQVLFQGAHNDWVLGTVFSADSSHLVSVSRDRSMKLIEVATQRFVDNITSITPGALKGGLASVDRHPKKDELVVGGADGVPKIYRMYRPADKARVIGDDFNLIRAFDALPGRIYAVQFSPDGERIVAGSSSDETGEIRVYEAGSGKLVCKFDGQPGPIYAARFSRDGKRVAAAGFSGKVVLMDAQTGKLINEFAPVPKIEDSLADRPVDASLPATNAAKSQKVSFVQDVMPTLSKLGCNAGTCHGSAQGKNGFKLSLRGYDPVFDHLALTDDLAARRFNRAMPEQSLMLLKPSGSVPHVGGMLIRPGEPRYELLKNWIAQGAKLDRDAPRVAKVEIQPAAPIIPLPKMQQQFRVLATYADGRVRDVTAEAFIESGNIEILEADKHGLITALRRGESPVLVRYEGNYTATTVTVMGDRSSFVWQDQPENNYIDALVYDKLKKVKTLPSGLCTDAEFIRRVYLDLTGLPPTSAEVRAFLADLRETKLKRDELIDRLVGSAPYVEQMTNKWADLLQVNNKYLGEKGAAALREWIRHAVATNMPYDKFAYAVLTASGSNIENPPASYFKVLRDPGDLMENTTQLFLAVRFNCNKCHDHPFERWTQNQHWKLAAFFAKVGHKDDPQYAKVKVGGTDVEGSKALGEVIFDGDTGEVRNPTTQVVQTPEFPYTHDDMPSAGDNLREQFAHWTTSAKNPYFAKSYVNRAWSYLMGPGFIEPIDDIRAGNPPTNPELLDKLTADFIASGFDVQSLQRLICKSRAYQLSVGTNEWNSDDTLNYSHATARRLPAEVLYDAVYQVTGTTRRLSGMPAGARAAEERDPSVNSPDGFLDLFGRAARQSSCECERSSGMMLGQALNLINGPTIAGAINEPSNSLTQLVASEKDDARLVEELFLRILCRPPLEREMVAGIDTLNTFEGDHAKLVAELTAYEKTLAAKQAEWEKRLSVPVWTPLEIGIAKSAAGATLSQEADLSVFASGKLAKDTYTLVAATELVGITAIRLEALTDPRLPHNGPGRAPGNGNQVLSELRLTMAPNNDPAKAKPVTLQNAQADYNQPGWHVSGAIDGNLATGWALDGQTSKNHVAVFECKEDIGAAGGSLLIFTLDQQFGDGQHELGKFRLLVTTSKRPIGLAPLPENVAKILAVPAENRGEEQKSDVAAYYRSIDGELARLTQAVAQHSNDRANSRLLGAQDLAWALINSPAFLFNR
jgi:WD40 repeat protein